jgi:hypothetical protein
MSAIGSEMIPTLLRGFVVAMGIALPHQLDLVTPGTRPSAAMVRKQIRHIPNLRMYARGRPQIRQRLRNRTPNFGACFQRSIADFFAN